MTKEEALIYLENKQREMTDNRYKYSEQEIEANGAAILSVERDIAENPESILRTRVKDGKLIGYASYSCPKCGRRIKNTHMFCNLCGQRIEWGNT